MHYELCITNYALCITHCHSFRLVLTMDVSSLISSVHSATMLVNSFSVKKPVSYNNSSQYSDSLASLSEIFIFAEKSALLCPLIASFTFAPMLVPHLSNCFDKTNSFLLSDKYWYSLTTLTANALLFIWTTFSLILNPSNYALRIMHSQLCIMNYALCIKKRPSSPHNNTNNQCPS